MESKLQKKIIQYLEKDGWYVLKIIRCNKAGHPDLEAYKKNIFKISSTIMIEVKDKGKKAEPLQLVRHEQLKKCGVPVFLIDSWEEFEKQIKPIL